jgi:hypothetical protein
VRAIVLAVLPLILAPGAVRAQAPPAAAPATPSPSAIFS